MTVNANELSSAVLDSFALFVPEVESGWVTLDSGVLAGYTGVPAPTLNGVWIARNDPDPGVVLEALELVAATEAPHCIQFRPAAAPVLEPLARARGMTRERPIPLMALEPASEAEIELPSGLTIREITPAQSSIHAGILARGFQAPLEIMQQIAAEPMLSGPGTRCYVGEVDGVPVTTGLGRLTSDLTGIFNIATLPEHTRHGYGAAITRRAVADGFADGAHTAWLQASAAGEPVYERIGFRTVENWQIWITAAPGS